jgi:hypothetical protein
MSFDSSMTQSTSMSATTHVLNSEQPPVASATSDETKSCVFEQPVASATTASSEAEEKEPTILMDDSRCGRFNRAMKDVYDTNQSLRRADQSRVSLEQKDIDPTIFGLLTRSYDLLTQTTAFDDEISSLEEESYRLHEECDAMRSVRYCSDSVCYDFNRSRIQLTQRYPSAMDNDAPLGVKIILLEVYVENLVQQPRILSDYQKTVQRVRKESLELLINIQHQEKNLEQLEQDRDQGNLDMLTVHYLRSIPNKIVQKKTKLHTIQAEFVRVEQRYEECVEKNLNIERDINEAQSFMEHLRQQHKVQRELWEQDEDRKDNIDENMSTQDGRITLRVNQIIASSTVTRHERQFVTLYATIEQKELQRNHAYALERMCYELRSRIDKRVENVKEVFENGTYREAKEFQKELSEYVTTLLQGPYGEDVKDFFVVTACIDVTYKENRGCYQRVSKPILGRVCCLDRKSDAVALCRVLSMAWSATHTCPKKYAVLLKAQTLPDIKTHNVNIFENVEMSMRIAIDWDG